DVGHARHRAMRCAAGEERDRATRTDVTRTLMGGGDLHPELPVEGVAEALVGDLVHEAAAAIGLPGGDHQVIERSHLGEEGLHRHAVFLKVTARPCPPTIAMWMHRMARFSIKEALRRGPASTGRNPALVATSESTFLASASSLAKKTSAGTPARPGSL